MKTCTNFSIRDFNTFCVDIKAKYFVEVKDCNQLEECLEKFKNEDIFFLGGGSNVLFVNDWDGLIVKIDFKGIQEKESKGNEVYINFKAGEVWEDCVDWCAKKNYFGIENMTMIPGSLGGAVSQSIGAYGQEIMDVVSDIFVFDVREKKEKQLGVKDCGFGYRVSNFKNGFFKNYLITSATLKLKKDQDLNISYVSRYDSVFNELKSFAREPYSLIDVKRAIESQREKKLPSVDDFGTCGSFFKNPVVDLEKARSLEKEIEGLQIYEIENEKNKVKVPAGRLLEELGWKGKWDGNVGVFEKHALCVVTNKGASGKEILDFVKKMKESVKKKYGVELVEEVNLIF